MLVSRKRNYDFSDILDDQYTFELKEQDFYFQTDNRVLESYVEDIDGGDNFADYCKYIFGVLAEEEYFDCQ